MVFPSTITASSPRPMCGSGIRAENICSLRAFLILTRSRHEMPNLFHVHSADHPGIPMARDQTCKFELARLGELPDDLARLLRSDASCIRVGVLHLGILHHHFRVL